MNKRCTVLVALLFTSVFFQPVQAANSTQNQAVKTSSSFQVATVITGFALGNLISQYLYEQWFIHETDLVAITYPYAQEWYEEMATKYPQVHLEKVKFLQSTKDISVRQASWCSILSAIIYPEKSLIQINGIYERKHKGINPTKEELDFLAGQEGILLHEIGHINHKHIFKRFAVATSTLLGLTYIAHLLSTSQLIEPVYRTLAEKLKTPIGFLTFLTVTSLYSQYSEAQADDYACTHADHKALEGIGDLFTTKEFDHLAKLEYQAQHKFVPTSSKIGTWLQNLRTARVQNFVNKLKKSSFQRWWYDISQNGFFLTHPRSCNRAEKFKKAAQEKEQQKEEGLTA